MQTVTLNIADHAVEKIMAFLNDMPDVQVMAVPELSADLSNKLSSDVSTRTLSDVAIDESNKDNLAGIFAQYVTEPITDEEIEEAITAGIMARAMAGTDE